MLVAKDEKRKVAHSMKDALFQKNEVEAEIGSINTKFKAEVEGLEKVEPIFSTLKKIKGLVKEK